MIPINNWQDMRTGIVPKPLVLIWRIFQFEVIHSFNFYYAKWDVCLGCCEFCLVYCNYFKLSSWWFCPFVLWVYFCISIVIACVMFGLLLYFGTCTPAPILTCAYIAQICDVFQFWHLLLGRVRQDLLNNLHLIPDIATLC